MNPEWERVPDAIEPLTGYRMWHFARRGRRFELHSLTCACPRHCPWPDAGSDWVVATCAEAGRWPHRAPDERCTCGVYAMASLRRLLERMTPAWGQYDGSVIGRVDLAGKVIEHTDGFRAERARIAEILPLEGQTGVAMRLANHLGVQCSPVVCESDLLSPREREALAMVSSGSTSAEIANAQGISEYEAQRRLAGALDVLGAGARVRVALPWPPPLAV